MVILKNWLITISYEPADDIMFAKLPNVEEFGARELKHALEVVSENVVSYVVKNLLLDSSDVSVVKMEDRVYHATVKDFILKLTSTQLERLARLNNSIQNLESRAVSTVTEIFHQENSKIQFRAFNDKEAAMDWLRTPKFTDPL
ncbi:hypothetical protein [Rufibacter latericius]|uniref:STAS/SEC14 domain-containing protein n=1 Tax=Rufibacter latericius TaxID=2487040 RepID=A0A3M9MWD5_9BACT|nr:hypothetical protein [Rufibacter latericius]RNI29078.1 hypothetical protein EFB08_06510 [Rufibacter latericius]